MPNIPSPATQKNPISAPQQDQEVMSLIKRKGKPKEPPQIEKAVEQLRQVLQQSNIDPRVVVQVGDMAYRAYNDPTQYELAKDLLIKNKILTPEQLQAGSKDMILGTAMIAGKLAQKIIQGQ